MVDALGHGPRAAEAAALAVQVLERVALDAAAADVLNALDQGLSGSRGAAAMACMIHGEHIDGCGVGNVALRVQGSAIPVMLCPGILGKKVRQVRSFAGKLALGTRLVMFSDGIASQLDLTGVRVMPAAQAAETLMTRHRRDHDDATVLVADMEASA